MSVTQKVKIPTVKLNNGLEMPMLGLGTARTVSDSAEVQKALKLAIKMGYRLIDTAWIYFIDLPFNRAVKESVEESNGEIKREDLFLTCMLWNIFHSKDMAPMGLADSLKNYGLSYLDLYYIQWPVGFKESPGTEPYPKDENGKVIFSDVHYLETYRAMEELYDKGLIKGIGLSNFNISQVQDVLNNCRIKPVVNQIEVHPYFQNEKLVNFCQNNGLVVVAYAPLGAVDIAENRPELPNLLHDETLIRIGKKYNKSAAQVCLRWSVQKGCIPIPKSILPDQLVENAQIFDYQLNDEEMEEIKNLNKNLRIYTATEMKEHEFYPFNED